MENKIRTLLLTSYLFVNIGMPLYAMPNIESGGMGKDIKFQSQKALTPKYRQEQAEKYLESALSLIKDEENFDSGKLLDVAETYRAIGNTLKSQQLRGEVLNDMSLTLLNFQGVADLLKNGYRMIPGDEITPSEFNRMMRILEQSEDISIQGEFFDFVAKAITYENNSIHGSNRLEILKQYVINLAIPSDDPLSKSIQIQMFDSLIEAYGNLGDSNIIKYNFKHLIQLQKNTEPWINLDKIAISYTQGHHINIAHEGLQELLGIASESGDGRLVLRISEAYSSLEDDIIKEKGLNEILSLLPDFIEEDFTHDRPSIYAQVIRGYLSLNDKSIHKSIFPKIVKDISNSGNLSKKWKGIYPGAILYPVAKVYAEENYLNEFDQVFGLIKKDYDLVERVNAINTSVLIRFESESVWNISLSYLLSKAKYMEQSAKYFKHSIGLMDEYLGEAFDEEVERKYWQKNRKNITQYSRDYPQGRTLTEKEFDEYVNQNLLLAKEFLKPSSKINRLSAWSASFETVDDPALIDQVLINTLRLANKWKDLGGLDDIRHAVIEKYGTLADRELAHLRINGIASEANSLDENTAKTELLFALAKSYLAIGQDSKADIILSEISNKIINPSNLLKPENQTGEEFNSLFLGKVISLYTKEFKNYPLALEAVLGLLPKTFKLAPHLPREAAEGIGEWQDSQAANNLLEYLLTKSQEYQDLPSEESYEVHTSDLLSAVAFSYAQIEDDMLAEAGIVKTWESVPDGQYCYYQAKALLDSVEAASIRGNIDLTEQLLSLTQAKLESKENCDTQGRLIRINLNLARASLQAASSNGR